MVSKELSFLQNKVHYRSEKPPFIEETAKYWRWRFIEETAKYDDEGQKAFCLWTTRNQNKRRIW